MGLRVKDNLQLGLGLELSLTLCLTLCFVDGDYHEPQTYHEYSEMVYDKLIIKIIA